MNDFQIRGDVYAADMQKSLRTLAELTKKDVHQLVKDRAPTMARYLASWTMPVANMGKNAEGNPDGESLTARNLGQSAVSRDIGRVYMDVRGLMAQLKGKRVSSESGKGVAASTLLSKMIKQGDNDRAEKIVRTVPGFAHIEIKNFDDGKRHKEKRRQGRVHKNTKPVVIADSQKLREYIKNKREQVGFTKSAWITAGRMAGGKNGLRAKWITKHNAPAHGAFKMIGAIGEAVLSSRVPWIDKKLNESGAMEAFDRSFKKEIQTATSKIIALEQRKK